MTAVVTAVTRSEIEDFLYYEAALLDAVAASQPFAQLCEVAATQLADSGAAASAVIMLLRQWLEAGLLRAESQG